MGGETDAAAIRATDPATWLLIEAIAELEGVAPTALCAELADRLDAQRVARRARGAVLDDRGVELVAAARRLVAAYHRLAAMTATERAHDLVERCWIGAGKGKFSDVARAAIAQAG